MVAEVYAHVCVGCPRRACSLSGQGNRVAHIGLLAMISLVMARNRLGLGPVRVEKEDEDRVVRLVEEDETERQGERCQFLSKRRVRSGLEEEVRGFAVLTLGQVSQHVLPVFSTSVIARPSVVTALR